MDLPQQRPHHDIGALFRKAKGENPGFLRVSAPMVRYSKFEFRRLLRKNGVQLCFTPMIIADSFNHSQKARLNEFTTAVDDQPLIAQFAAKNPSEFVTAAQLIYPYVDGIDLNCGCPQSWAISKGYGCGLLRQPELVRDCVQQVRRTLPQDFSISVKIRLLHADTVRTTVALAQQLEHCGVSFLTVHGRTASQRRTEDVLNIPAMAELKQSMHVPLIVNGSVRCWKDACDLYEQTQADGVMAARGLLSNPTLFSETYKHDGGTPDECVRQWLDIAASAGDNIHFQCFHHHLTFMWSSHMRKDLRLIFNNLNTKEEVYNFFSEIFDIHPLLAKSGTVDHFEYTKCSYDHFAAPMGFLKQTKAASNEWDANTDGKYFKEFKSQVDNVKDEVQLAGSFFSDLLF